VATVEMVNSTAVPFPTFTICPHMESAFNASFLESYGLNVTDVENGLFLGSIGDYTMREFYNLASVQLPELVQMLVVTTLNADQDGNYQATIYPNSTGVWQLYMYFYFGNCFAMTLPNSISARVVYSIEFHTFGR
jgi:hypothetical protein